MARSIEERASFELVRYANCWEDADILCAALEPAGRRLLSIASGGDNCFALVAAGAAEVVAADVSPAQLAVVELKAAAVRHLEREQTLAFLGLRPADDRLATFEGLAGELSDGARGYWRDHRDRLAAGVVHQGKFESYFQLFRTRVLPWIHRRQTVLALMQERDAAARRAFYDRRWNNLRWRLLFRLFFSRFAMGRLGRDPEFFRYVEGSVAERILERSRYALTELTTHDNPYLEYILTGNFGRNLPLYLRPGPYRDLRQRLGALTLFEGPIQEAARQHAGDGLDGFNLSDVFEYLDAAMSTAVYRELLEHARPGARLVYWNMLVPRSCPEELRGRIRPREDLARKLFARDQAFFYSAFLVEEVT